MSAGLWLADLCVISKECSKTSQSQLVCSDTISMKNTVHIPARVMYTFVNIRKVSIYQPGSASLCVLSEKCPYTSQGKLVCRHSILFRNTVHKPAKVSWYMDTFVNIRKVSIDQPRSAGIRTLGPTTPKSVHRPARVSW